MSAPALVRFYHPDHGARLGLWTGDQVHDIGEHFASPGAWLRASAGRVAAAIEEMEAMAARSSPVFLAALFDAEPTPDQPHWLAPVEEQDVWAAGVTYERSRQARQEEALDGGDIYARVYGAERPELFFKAQGRHVVGPRGAVGIRADARWSVPEPELAVVFNPALEAVGFSVGHDMSSRDIEGANPLYLPQAKVYTASCALGPGIVLAAAADWPAATIRLSIRRAGKVAFEGEVHTARIRRRLAELAQYLGRSNQYPDGVVLLTGTGIVPPPDFTLAAGDVVEIAIDGIGTLTNPVQVV
jgi:2-dehydro-3-deoxy-D-arabinonate dehydratase